MICISIEEMDFDTCKLLAESTDMIEFRLDRSLFTEEQISALFNSPATLIATCRPGFKDETVRLRELLAAIRSGADYVDIELENNPEFISQIISAARKMMCKVIISHHDYEKTPSQDELIDFISKCREQEPDIIKIACNANTSTDCSRMISLYDLAALRLGVPPDKLIAFALGDKGTITRIASLYLGAPFAYASASAAKATASGQIDIVTFESILKAIGK